MEKIEKLIRDFENTEYYGYIFSISYRGEMFDSFDENPGGKSVKSEFKKLLIKNGISIFKGIQQAGRTDKKVNGKGNALYVSCKDLIEFSEMKYRESEGIEIFNVEKTLPFLEFPSMIEKRHYIYEYPENMIKNKDEEIYRICEEISGKRNFKEFTSKKGEKLKNHIRDISVKYKNKKLYFEGDGFLPQQVRIMSNYILNGKKSPLEGEYLTLEKVEFSKELSSLIFKNVKHVDEIVIDRENFSLEEAGESLKDVVKIEKNEYFNIFYVNFENKGKFIGKKGKNIKKLKKIYGNIIIKRVM